MTPGGFVICLFVVFFSALYVVTVRAQYTQRITADPEYWRRQLNEAELRLVDMDHDERKWSFSWTPSRKSAFERARASQVQRIDSLREFLARAEQNDDDDTCDCSLNY